MVLLLDDPTTRLDLPYPVLLFQELKDWASNRGRSVFLLLLSLTLPLDLAYLFLFMEVLRARFFGPAADFDPAVLNRVYQMDVGGYMRRSLKRWEELK